MPGDQVRGLPRHLTGEQRVCLEEVVVEVGARHLARATPELTAQPTYLTCSAGENLTIWHEATVSVLVRTGEINPSRSAADGAAAPNWLHARSPPPRVGLDDDGLIADCASRGKPRFGLGKQPASQSAAAVGGSHDQSIDRSSPPIPAGDHRADEPAVAFGHDQRRWVMDDQLIAIGEMNARLAPGEIGPVGAVIGPTHLDPALDLVAAGGIFLAPGVGRQGATPG